MKINDLMKLMVGLCMDVLDGNDGNLQRMPIYLFCEQWRKEIAIYELKSRIQA